MKLVVGLGNPGSKYAATRHNVGFRVVDELARRHGMETSQERFHGWFAKGVIGQEDTVLLKPTTFMNRSGQAVLAAGRFYKLELDDVLVITDDLALPLGKIRLRSKGGAGGHNGLKDIIARLGSDEFDRLRLGIDSPLGDQVGFVLSAFTESDEVVITQSCASAADAVECWIAGGIADAMNRFNA